MAHLTLIITLPSTKGSEVVIRRSYIRYVQLLHTVAIDESQ